MSSEGWFTTGEACAVLGISRTTLLAAETAGVLAAVRTPGGHRRYPAAELQRYLGVPVPPRPRPVEDRPRAVVIDAGVARTVSDAVRPLARALDAECAGLYLTGPDGWSFAGAAGIPRWLAARLTDEPPPEQVVASLEATSAQLFEPAAVGFPDGRSAGHGIVAGVGAGDRRYGTLFLVTRPGNLPLPAELRMVEAAAELLGLLVAQLAEVSALRGRLRRIATLCDNGGALGDGRAPEDRRHPGSPG
ncbi:helix-turn-helix domain-containing protein [Pseudonocardia nematodicida]|uniref:Helix-turn-helix domain-containing protein n=1 Tax=Pseudonocardia nematodicida TaxID=1206997 RepID=A0ABV1KDU5_9PSEU